MYLGADIRLQYIMDSCDGSDPMPPDAELSTLYWHPYTTMEIKSRVETTYREGNFLLDILLSGRKFKYGKTDRRQQDACSLNFSLPLKKQNKKIQLHSNYIY